MSAGVEDARQASTSGHMRWVLVISTVLAIVAMGAAWFALRPSQAGRPSAPVRAAESPQQQRDMTPSPNPPKNAGPQTH